MVVEALLGLFTGLLGRFGRAVRGLIRLHVEALRREAEQDAKRLAMAMVLFLFGGLLCSVALMVLNAALAAVLQQLLGSWPAALAALGGGELALGLMTLGLGYLRATEKPLLSQSRAMIAETAKTLREG